MEKPPIIHVGNRMFNIQAVRYIEIEGMGNLVNVHLTEGVTLQFEEEEAESLLGILELGYIQNGKIEQEKCAQFAAEVESIFNKPKP